MATILVPVVATFLTKAPTTPLGWVIAVLGIPALWMVDAIYKARRRRHAGTSPMGREVTP